MLSNPLAAMAALPFSDRHSVPTFGVGRAGGYPSPAARPPSAPEAHSLRL